MANSMATFSRKLYRALLWHPKILANSAKPFSLGNHLPASTFSSSSFRDEEDSELYEDPSVLNSGHNAVPDPEEEEERHPSGASSSPLNGEAATQQRAPLENGLDHGIYKAILVGVVGPSPLQKALKNGMKLTLLTVGTGGIRNNRRPLESEDPREYANRSDVLWHRVAVYQRNLGDLIMKNVQPGSIVYLEGNLETKIFPDPMTGLVRRVREIAVRRNGRFVFLGKGDGEGQGSPSETRRVGYY